MKTLHDYNSYATYFLFLLFLTPVFCFAQIYSSAISTGPEKTKNIQFLPNERSTFRDFQEWNTNVMLELDYHQVVQAVGNSDWWTGLSEVSRRAIQEKIRSMGDSYSYQDLLEIEEISEADDPARPELNSPGRSLCPAGDVLLTNQDEVDAFGALNCTGVTGHLYIEETMSSSPKITDLTPLSSLTSVSGRLVIHATQLTSLEGLSNITTVGYLHIDDCDALTDLEGLSGLITCTGPLTNPCSCSDDQNHIRGNENLVDFSGLSNLESIASGLFINNNPSLKNADGLSALGYIGGALAIEHNPSLRDVKSLSSLVVIDRDLVIRDNPSLHHLNGFQNLGTVGAWTIIEDNDALRNLEGLSGLTSIAGRFFILSNENLRNLEGVSNLSHVGEIVWVENNANIRNLEGLNSISSVGGLWILFNPQIRNIDGIEGLTSIGYGGLVLFLNPSLNNINGMSNITWVGGDMIFQDLASLGNVGGASNVTYVGGICGIATCPLVRNVDGFSNITYAGFGGGAFDMAALENVDGFSNVTYMGGDLLLFDNPSLVSCCGIYQLLCSNPPACSEDAVDGNIVIFNNPSACSSIDEILASGPCVVPDAQPIQINQPVAASNGEGVFEVYPNPAGNHVDIRISQFAGEAMDIRLVDSQGRTLMESRISDIQKNSPVTFQLPSSIPNGVYHFVLVQANEVATRPLVIQR